MEALGGRGECALPPAQAAARELHTSSLPVHRWSATLAAAAVAFFFKFKIFVVYEQKL